MALVRDSSGKILFAKGDFQAGAALENMGEADTSGMRQWVLSHSKTGMVPLARMPRTVLVHNRAEKGYVKVWYGVRDGQMYPDGAVSDDKSTWLQPGEDLYLPTEIALGLFGMFGIDGPEANKERLRVIIMHGNWQFEGIPFEGSKKNVSMNIIGPPPKLPDLMLSFVDQRNKSLSEPISFFDWCVGTTRYRKQVDKAIAHRDAEELEIRKREFSLEPA